MWNIFKRKEKLSEKEKNQKQAQNLVAGLYKVVAARREGHYKIDNKSTEAVFEAIRYADYPLQVLKFAIDFAKKERKNYQEAASGHMPYEDLVIYNEIVEDYENYKGYVEI